MEDASNGISEETQKTEYKELVIDGGSEQVKELKDKKDSSSSSDSSSDEEEDEAPVEKILAPSPGPVLVEDEKVSDETVVVDSTEPVGYVLGPGDDSTPIIAEEAEYITESLQEKSEEIPGVDKSKEFEVEKIVSYVEEANGVEAKEILEKVIEETISTSAPENGEVAPPENQAEPSAVSTVLHIEEERTVESLETADSAAKESKDVCPPPPLESVPPVGTEPESAVAEHVDDREIPESTGNTPIIPVSHRVVHPTSWRSCCGLFEVLRRDR